MTTVGVLAEQGPESRVALVPKDAARLVAAGHEVLVQSGAGAGSGVPDDDYASAGAALVAREDLLARAALLLAVRAPGAEGPALAPEELTAGQVVVGLCDPLGNPAVAAAVAATGATAFSLELLPRTTRAQAMDVLSSQAVLAGYRAALLGAERLGKVLPMMSTAAGTLAPAKVLVVGAGVAGLSAIATSRRLGAVVSAYDVRPEAREQVESVGGAFVELPLDTSQGSAEGGYAKDLGAEFLQRQQELLAATVAASDIVITTAQVPGRRAPVIVTEAMVRGMAPGSVLVDIAAAQGGNCALTQPDGEVLVDGVHVLGPKNLAGTVATHASQLFSKNVSAFLALLLDAEGSLAFDTDDVLVAGTLVSRDGAVVHPLVLEQAAAAPALTPSGS